MSDEDSDMDCSDTEVYDDDYYVDMDDRDLENDERPKNPEDFPYECLCVEDVERLLNESVEVLSNKMKVSPSTAKVLLHCYGWDSSQVTFKCRTNSNTLPAIKFSSSSSTSDTSNQLYFATATTTSTAKRRQLAAYCTCPVCTSSLPLAEFYHLGCQHQFCKTCWAMHFEVQIQQGVTTEICCMARECSMIVPEDMVLALLDKPHLRNKYQQFAFRDYVKAHPQLRFCSGANCQLIFRAKEPKAKRVTCTQCKTSLCFNCGMDYHAPTDCRVIKKWLTKCADDSETANYISAHTKDCPKCHICIEKNGGCNHMQCYSCKHDFCWMCLGDWRAHGSEYYECSRYKENPNIAHESVHVQAREDLKKYLHYYERWENHAVSLKLEEQTLEKLRTRINEKVMNNLGTWIDWQYLFVAATLLAKCRYTLQYTYPYAYYMESGPRKELFEYQQAQLEAEIENLSWKIEHAETTDRAEVENQMDIAEKRRMTLLKDFLDV